MENEAAIWSGISVGVLGVGLGAAGLGFAVQAHSDVNSLQTQFDGLRDASVNLVEASAKLTVALTAMEGQMVSKMSLSGLLAHVGGIASVTEENVVEANSVTCIGGNLGQIDGEQLKVTSTISNNNSDTYYTVTTKALQLLKANSITTLTFPNSNQIPSGTRITLINFTGNPLTFTGFGNSDDNTPQPIKDKTARTFIYVESMWIEVT
jgi:hypothetical protein